MLSLDILDFSAMTCARIMVHLTFISAKFLYAKCKNFLFYALPTLIACSKTASKSYFLGKQRKLASADSHY
jgi:hypothetical protein